MSCPLLSVENVTFLDKGPFSFSLASGECLGLAGKSGIGKTQMLRAITDLIPFDGQILLDGKKSSSFSPTEWRSRVTMVPADSSWWYERVGGHFPAIGDNKQLIEACTQLGLDKEVLGWQVSRLSTGEKQRLALLRGLQNNPAVLLLDEPSSGLDNFHTSLLEELIDSYRAKSGMSLVWVSHDPLQLGRVATRQLHMEQYQLTELS